MTFEQWMEEKKYGKMILDIYAGNHKLCVKCCDKYIEPTKQMLIGYMIEYKKVLSGESKNDLFQSIDEFYDSLNTYIHKEW
jgi:hypothetical protein